MKKILSILAIGLFLISNANSKIIELKKCSIGSDKGFDSKRFDKRSYVINTQKSLVQRVTVLSETYYEDQKKKFIESFGNTQGLNKISIFNFKIEYADNTYAKAVKEWTDHTGDTIYTSVEIDIKKKKVLYKSHQKAEPSTHQCK